MKMDRRAMTGSARGLMAATAVALVLPSTASAVPVSVQITNLAPERGTFVTPFFVGFHDGGFEIYDLGEPASRPLEFLAELGRTQPLSQALDSPGSVDGRIPAPGGFGGPRFAPGETATATFDLDPVGNRFFSYASMVIPSNDAFIASDEPIAIFGQDGSFLGADILVLGSDVLDAGTEVNTEIPDSTLFLGFPAEDKSIDDGIAENDVVRNHPGFIPEELLDNDELPEGIDDQEELADLFPPRLIDPQGPGMVDIGILDEPMFANADFERRLGYQVARIQVISPAPPPGEVVPAIPLPAPALLLSSGLLGLIGLGLRRRRGA